MVAFELIKFFLLSMAIATVSLTITKAVVFESIREFIKERMVFLGKLISCPYCFSHWISFMASFYFNQHHDLSYNIVYSFALVCLASVFMGLIYNSISQMQD